MKLTLIGTGNAATHLARLFYQAGHTIEGIYSRNPDRARRLARLVRARVVRSLKDMAVTDCLVIAVKDDALAGLVARLPDMQALVLHTSGSEPLSVLKRFRNRGVLYPVQTLTAGAPLPDRIPFCIEAGNEPSLRKVRKLANSISGRVVIADSRKRLVVHMAAVFVNNFTNHLYAIAHRLLSRERIPFDILEPLMEETARKAEMMDPAAAQTGPARRGDRKTMQKHLRLLARNKKAAAVYKLLSADISSPAGKTRR